MKKQIKKSLSLFLAVLMLLTSWVWVAPEKAAAAVGENYYVEVIWRANRTGQNNALSDDYDDGGSCIGFFVKSKDNYGTGTEYSTTADLRGGKTDYDNTWTGTVTGFPTSFIFIIDHGSIAQNAMLYIKSIKIGASSSNKIEVFNGEIYLESSTKFKRFQLSVGNTWTSNDPDYAKLNKENSATWALPNPSVDATTTETVTLNKVNTGITTTATTELSIVDQYGVSWSSFKPTFKMSSAGVNITNDHVTMSTSGRKATLTIRPWFQTLFPGKESAKISVDWSNVGAGTNFKSGTETIEVMFPEYTATFHSNGGKIGTNDAEALDTITYGKIYKGKFCNRYIENSNGTVDKCQILYKDEELVNGKCPKCNSSAYLTDVYEGDSLYVGSVIGEAPQFATRTGYEFKGFYSKQNADAYGRLTSFEGTKFEDKKTKVPRETNSSNDYDSDMVYDSNKSPFYGDTDWYAAWQSAPINVTFVTADNQLIGTVEGRYGNYMSASDMYGADLNTYVRASHTEGKVKFNAAGEPVYTDGSTTYTFAGWKIIKAYDDSLIDGGITTVLEGDVTFQAVYTRESSKTYKVQFKNTQNVVFDSKDTYKYRDSIILPSSEGLLLAGTDKYTYEFIGWAKDVGKDPVDNYYTVDENDMDEDGAKIVYTHKDSSDFIVTGDVTYVPVFRRTYVEYDVTFNYTLNDEAPASVTVNGYHWDDTLLMPEISDNYTAEGYRHFIIGWKIGNAGKTLDLDEIQVGKNLQNANFVLTAVYGNVVPAEYTINFYGKDTDGETDILLNADANIYEHGDEVAAPEAPDKIDTADSLYEFVKWSPDINSTASGDAEYRAIYEKKDYADVHFYNYDGSLIYEVDGKANGNFKGDVIPAYENLVDGVNVLPTREEDMVGTYTFKGWKDSSGNVVVPGTNTFSGDTYLTAWFETTYTEYRVRFVNDDGTLILTAKYHYGDEITIPANPTKASDVEYIYDFRAWSPNVSEYCLGEATYTAIYRRTPQYYKVTWLNDKKETFSESNYPYNGKINQAVINEPAGKDAAPTGQEWAFDEWIQCDAEGYAINAEGVHVEEPAAARFYRGQRMGGEDLYFYPTFKLVSEKITVTFYKADGTTLLGTAKVPYGENLTNYADEFAATAVENLAATATHHSIVEKWVNTVNGNTVTAITEEVAVKAVIAEEAHTWGEAEVTVEPTCNIPGYADYRCTTSGCTYINTNVVIPTLPDEGKPSGQLYVGTNKWTSADFEAGIDYADVKYVGPTAQLVVNAKDIGTASAPYNENGKLARGVGKIEYALLTKAVTDPTTITQWNEIYNIEALKQDALNAVLKEYKLTLLDYNSYIRGTTEQRMKKAEIDRAVDSLLASYNANATSVVSNLNLEDGKEYIIYIRITDREGNGEVNTGYLSSGTISYGSKAPVVTATGEGYGSKFCAEATITVTDDTDGVTAYLNGEEVALTDGVYVCTTNGVHTITVVDKHGNKTTKNFEVKGNHTYKNYTVAATCENAGSRYDKCTVCGSKANVTVLPAFGHSYTVSYVDKAPTCVDNGYRTYVCDNNCGTKLVLKPTDDAAKLAQAKVKVDPEDEDSEWRDLTADDLKALVATGIHTYEKVKDANGEDTNEDVWVVDKAATCKETGSKHKDCIKCGERVTDTIAVDAVNGHKFYREKVTKEPTCTDKGEKTKTCRYCGTTEKVADLDALGHTEGEYRVITAATCTEKGSKILTCAICGTDMGEAVEIPATDHAWKVNGEVYEEAGKYYQNYVCKNDNNHTKREEVADYKPPVAAVVTFDFGKNGGHYVIPAVGNPDEFGYVPEMLKGTQTVNAYVGETISADEVETALKQNNKTKTFTFSHWEDADGKNVDFPIEVKGDATYYAVFTEKFINYTITYYKDDMTEYKKTGYLHNGVTETLAAGPSKAATNLVTYKFVGWVVYGSNPEVVYTNEVTIDGADINLVAKYKEVKKQYAVTYAYSKSEILETFAVYAGDKARDCAIVPEKEFDSKYHYNFTAWNRADQLAKVESNIYTTPDFDAVLHSYDHEGGKVLKSAATCTDKAVYTYTCTCGYSFDKAEGDALEHSWGAPVYNAETGKNVIKCTRVGCGESQEDTRSFTAKFYVNADDTQDIKTVSYIAWGTKIDSTKLPATPGKDSTATTDYTFKGWAVKGDATETIIDFTNYEVKADVDFVAVFTGTTREYSVIFAYDANNVIQIFSNVKAGSSVSFEGDMPVQEFDENYHYTFTNWAGYEAGEEGEEQKITITNVQSDLRIYAAFSKTKHTYDYNNGTSIGEATCTQGIGTRYTCTGCEKFYDVTGKPLDHDFSIEIDRKDATLTEEGYIVYKCATCPEGKEATYTKKLPKLESTTTYVNVKVQDSDGRALAGANVDLYVDGTYQQTVATNSYGEVTFLVDKGHSYSFLVEYDGKDATGGLREAQLGEGVVNTVVVNISKCSCACHGDGIWSAIFRFFHKIIKMFTGEFKCCKDPDARYN